MKSISEAQLAERQSRVALAKAKAAADVTAAMLNALPDTERKAELRRRIAERQASNRADRQARIATARAEKEATKMTTMQAKDWTTDAARDATKRMHAGGYTPVTIIPHTLTKANKDAGKIPGGCTAGRWHLVKDWADEAAGATLAQALDWYGQTPSAPNVGVLCGVKTERGYVVGIDIDCLAPEVLEGLSGLCDGSLYVRTGREDRSGLVPLVVDTLEVSEVFSCGADKIQLLKSGKQFVAQGIHPQRLEPYSWATYDATLGEVGAPCAMPSVAQLPAVQLSALLSVFEAEGFKAGNATNVADANDRKSELRSNLESDDELDGDDFGALFGDGGTFPLDELAEDNPAFSKNLTSWGEDYEPSGEDVSHHARRVSFYKDILRAYPAFKVEYAKVLHLSGKLPGLGRYTGVKEGDGSITDAMIASAYQWAERKIARERSGEEKAHASTKGNSKGEAFDSVDDGGDDAPRKPKKSETTAEPEDEPAARSNVIYLDDIRAQPPVYLEWAVKHFIARDTTTAVSGQWGAGKTAVFLDIALHIAAGLAWHGKKVTQGVVIYAGLENPEDIARRVRAWCELMEAEGHELNNVAFVQHRGPLSLVHSDLKQVKATKDEKALIATAMEAKAHFGMPVAMVVVDTVSQSILPGNVNEHAGLYMKALDRIKDATGANVTALHHPTKTGEALKGGGEFFGNSDTVILVARDPKTGLGTIAASPEKFRIGDPSQASFAYRLRAHKIGVDEDGEDINVVLAVRHDTEAQYAVNDEKADEVMERRLELLRFETAADWLGEYIRLEAAAATDAETNSGWFVLSDELYRDATVRAALDHFAPSRKGQNKGAQANESRRRKQYDRALAQLEERKSITLVKRIGKPSVVRLA